MTFTSLHNSASGLPHFGAFAAEARLLGGRARGPVTRCPPWSSVKTQEAAEEVPAREPVDPEEGGGTRVRTLSDLKAGGSGRLLRRKERRAHCWDAQSPISSAARQR